MTIATRSAAVRRGGLPLPHFRPEAKREPGVRVMRPHGRATGGTEIGGGTGLEDPAGLGKQNFGGVASGVPKWRSKQTMWRLCISRVICQTAAACFLTVTMRSCRRTSMARGMCMSTSPKTYLRTAAYACSPASASGSEVFKPARSFEAEGRKGEAGAGCVALISRAPRPKNRRSSMRQKTAETCSSRRGAALLRSDSDGASIVWDAHECTPASPCIPPRPSAAPVQTEASCKPAPTPQPTLYGAPAQRTFSGPGNVTPVPASDDEGHEEGDDVSQRQDPSINTTSASKTRDQRNTRPRSLLTPTGGQADETTGNHNNGGVVASVARRLGSPSRRTQTLVAYHLRNPSDLSRPAAAKDETLRLTVSATAGKYTIGRSEKTKAALHVEGRRDVCAVQEALEKLYGNGGKENVEVTGTSSEVYEITFVKGLADRYVQPVVVKGVEVTGGAHPAVEVKEW